MSEPTALPPLSRIAPASLGAILFASASLFLGSCKPKSTADWDTPGSEPAPAAQISVLPQSKSQAPTTSPETTPTTPTAPAEASGSLRFIGYNVENWLVMDRYVDGKNLKDANKPEEQKLAVITILARLKPDVLGLCEIGQKEDILDLQTRLRAAGVDLPNLHYVGGVDPTRHLALLSRFPISRTANIAKSDYSLEGQSFSIQRGVLDATVTANGSDYRFIGVHLKSKREVENGDQAAMRLNEAHLVRSHIETILSTDPSTKLAVYGDFNDTRASPAIKLIQGSYNHPQYLTPLPLKDRRGEYWTHFWEREDVYSRFDWIFVSQPLKPEVNFDASRILDEPEWDKASDHRAVMMLLK